MAEVILEIENHYDFSSQIVQDTIKLFREQLHDSYIAICELRQKIDKELGNPLSLLFNLRAKQQ